MNDELIRRMNRIKNNLNSARNELRYAQNILMDSITINGETFMNDDFSIIKNKLDVQINVINSKIIPKIKGL